MERVRGTLRAPSSRRLPLTPTLSPQRGPRDASVAGAPTGRGSAPSSLHATISNQEEKANAPDARTDRTRLSPHVGSRADRRGKARRRAQDRARDHRQPRALRGGRSGDRRAVVHDRPHSRARVGHGFFDPSAQRRQPQGAHPSRSRRPPHARQSAVSLGHERDRRAHHGAARAAEGQGLVGRAHPLRDGWGYLKRGNSPYLWSWTSEYHGGKYVRDGVYDANHWDAQAGCVALLKALAALE